MSNPKFSMQTALVSASANENGWQLTSLLFRLTKLGAVTLVSTLLIAIGIFAFTERQILNTHKLKAWRHHLRLSPKAQIDAVFVKSIKEIRSNATNIVTRILQHR